MSSSKRYPEEFKIEAVKQVTEKIWSQEVHPLPLIDQLHQTLWMDDLADKSPERSMDEFYWHGFNLLRSRLIKDFNEKGYIQKKLHDSEFHIKSTL